MDNNLTHKEQIHTYVIEIIIRDIISKIPKLVEKKKLYEKCEEEYSIQNGKYINSVYQIRNLNSQESKRYKLDNNHHIVSYNTQLSDNYGKMLLESIKIRLKKNRLYDEMCVAKKEYDDAFKLLISYFNKYKESELKYMMDYLDIEIDSNEIDNDGATIILKNIVRDFEVLEIYQLILPQDKLYRGTISLAETLVNQIRECETKIEKHNEYKKKLEFLSIEYLDNYSLIDEKENRKKQLESFFVNKLIKRDELEDLKFDLKSLYLTRQNILTEFDLYVNAVKILLNEKNEMCLKCVKNKLCIELVLDRLGEKSLRQLITNLNIVIPRSDDNYFNEKEEMKKLLKNWFEEALKQIIMGNELENSEFEEYIHINEDLSINKKQLVKK